MCNDHRISWKIAVYLTTSKKPDFDDSLHIDQKNSPRQPRVMYPHRIYLFIIILLILCPRCYVTGQPGVVFDPTEGNHQKTVFRPGVVFEVPAIFGGIWSKNSKIIFSEIDFLKSLSWFNFILLFVQYNVTIQRQMRRKLWRKT